MEAHSGTIYLATSMQIFQTKAEHPGPRSMPTQTRADSKGVELFARTGSCHVKVTNSASMLLRRACLKAAQNATAAQSVRIITAAATASRRARAHSSRVTFKAKRNKTEERQLLQSLSIATVSDQRYATAHKTLIISSFLKHQVANTHGGAF